MNEFEYKGFTYSSDDSRLGDKESIKGKSSEPPKLYKYYSYNNFSIDALRNQYLYASHPYQFNDSMDSSWALLDFNKMTENQYDRIWSQIKGSSFYEKRKYMKVHEFKNIIHKFLLRKTSKEEEKVLNEFEKRLLAHNAESVFEHTPSEIIQRELSKKIVKATRTRYTLVYQWAAVAALLILISVGSWWFSSTESTKIVASTPIEWQEVSTRKGETREVHLPDGSVVTLNGESSLLYPTTFSESVRKVTLIGEAFFEVTPNPDKSFVVQTEQLSTEVLGTSFNIEAYAMQKDVKVTLATGKVRVKAGMQELILAPAQQAVYQKDKAEMYAKQVNIALYTDWRKGILHFDESSLIVVAAQIEKFYGIPVQLEVKDAEHYYISGTFVKEPLEVVLKQLSFTDEELTYKFIGGKLLISHKK